MSVKKIFATGIKIFAVCLVFALCTVVGGALSGLNKIAKQGSPSSNSAAGYAPVYPHTGLDKPQTEAARRAVELLMVQLEPYPVIVVDRYWNTLKMNVGAKRFLALFPECDSGTPHNGVRLVFHPQGLRPFIENWESVAARIKTTDYTGAAR